MTQTNFFQEAVLAFLAPLLLVGSITDMALARQAAQQAIDAYGPKNPSDPVAISQIVALAVTCLDTLRISNPQDVSLSMKLRLRTHANTMSRSSQSATEILRRNQQSEGPDWQEDPEPEIQPEPAAQAAPQTTPEPAPATVAKPGKPAEIWADRMQVMARQLQARSNIVPPGQRKLDKLWTEILTDSATHLRSSLLGSTILASQPAPAAVKPPT